MKNVEHAFALLGGLDAKADDQIYHNTKLLLTLYSKVAWRMSNSIAEMDEICHYAVGNNLYEVVDSLIDVAPDLNQARIESRLQSLEDSKSILMLIDQALTLLKNYPEHGARYHEILKACYLDIVRPTEAELLEMFMVSRSTFFREKKKAIKLLGVILWGFIIPDLKKAHAKTG